MNILAINIVTLVLYIVYILRILDFFIFDWGWYFMFLFVYIITILFIKLKILIEMKIFTEYQNKYKNIKYDFSKCFLEVLLWFNLIFKLTGILHWSWWLVFYPIWLAIIIVIVISPLTISKTMDFLKQDNYNWVPTYETKQDIQLP